MLWHISGSKPVWIVFLFIATSFIHLIVLSDQESVAPDRLGFFSKVVLGFEALKSGFLFYNF
jgi:hypothetical protein